MTIIYYLSKMVMFILYYLYSNINAILFFSNHYLFVSNFTSCSKVKKVEY